jgi:hypothetical protein
MNPVVLFFFFKDFKMQVENKENRVDYYSIPAPPASGEAKRIFIPPELIFSAYQDPAKNPNPISFADKGYHADVLEWWTKRAEENGWEALVYLVHNDFKDGLALSTEVYGAASWYLDFLPNRGIGFDFSVRILNGGDDPEVIPKPGTSIKVHVFPVLIEEAYHNLELNPEPKAKDDPMYYADVVQWWARKAVDAGWPFFFGHSTDYVNGFYLSMEQYDKDITAWRRDISPDKLQYNAISASKVMVEKNPIS